MRIAPLTALASLMLAACAPQRPQGAPTEPTSPAPPASPAPTATVSSSQPAVSAPAPEPAHTATPATPPAASSDPTVARPEPEAKPADPCKVLSKRFDARLQSSPGTCRTSAGCAQYDAGIGRSCGGATDRASARELAKIAAEFRKLSCRYTIRCGPRVVYGVECSDGYCDEISKSSSLFTP